MLASLLVSVLLTASPAHPATPDTLDPATGQPTKASHAQRHRRGTVEYTGPVGREQHILGDEGDEEPSVDSVARKPKRIRLGRKP